MDIPWEDVELFLVVAQTGSLSGAARQLRIGQPTVSRRLAALEYLVGTPLFLRRPDGVALTTEGERLVEPARKMAEWAGEVSRAAAASDGRPHGVVRVTAAPLVCFEYLAPFAAVLARRQLGPRLEVLSTMQYLDLARGEADLALRGKAPSQPDLKVVYSFELENAVFVSPALAARLPKKPTLAELPWIGWAPPFDNIPPQPQLEAMIPGFSPAFTSDNFLVHLSAAEAGVGAVVLFRMPSGKEASSLCHRSRALVPLPIDLGAWSTVTVNLVAARSALDVPRVRVVTELLVEELKKISKAT